MATCRYANIYRLVNMPPRHNRKIVTIPRVVRGVDKVNCATAHCIGTAINKRMKSCCIVLSVASLFLHMTTHKCCH